MIPDETELDYLSFYVDLPILLMHFLSHTTLSEAEKDRRNLTYRSMVIHFLSTRHYRLHTYSQYDGMRMACFHPIVLDTFHHPVEKTNFILDLIVSSHLATLTHSVMVSYLAEALLKYIFDDKPELLICPALGSTVSEIQKTARISLISPCRVRCFTISVKRNRPDHQHAAPQADGLRVLPDPHASGNGSKGSRLCS